jgi:hypothetical protein
MPTERKAAAFAALGTMVLAGPLLAQQTIFNVPSADVLDPGKVYLEVDELFRPTDPEFSSTTVRGVFGAIPRMEVGVNFGGLNAPGPPIPTATLAVKLQPVRAGEFTLTAGGYGLFYLKGSSDGNPAGRPLRLLLPKLRTRIPALLGGLRETHQHGRRPRDPRAAAPLGQGPDPRRGLVERRERDRLRQSGSDLHVRALDRLRGLLDQERRLAGQRRAHRARVRILRSDHAGPDFSRGDDPPVLAVGRLRAPLRPDLREDDDGMGRRSGACRDPRPALVPVVGHGPGRESVTP